MSWHAKIVVVIVSNLQLMPCETSVISCLYVPYLAIRLVDPFEVVFDSLECEVAVHCAAARCDYNISTPKPPHKQASCYGKKYQTVVEFLRPRPGPVIVG